MSEYAANIDHLRDELRRLDILLKAEVEEFRHRMHSEKPGEFLGLYISDQEVDDLLVPDREKLSPRRLAALQAAVNLETEIQEKVSQSQTAGVFLRLPHVCKVFGLSSFETDLLLLALAPEIDLRYRKLYAFLQDDVTRKSPSVDLALRLFCLGDEERLRGRESFSPHAPLFAPPLLGLFDDPAEGPIPLLARQFRLEPRLTEFLLGSDRLDARLVEGLPLARWETGRLALDDLILPDGVQSGLERIASQAQAGVPLTCLLYGPQGSGKTSCARGVASLIGRSLLVVNLPACLQSALPFDRLIGSALREASLYGSVVYCEGWQVLTGEDPAQRLALRVMGEALAGFPGLSFLGSREPWQPDLSALLNLVSIELTVPGERQRVELWQRLLPPETQEADVDLAYLAGAFRFSGGQIQRAVGHAQNSAWLKGNERASLTTTDLIAGCRIESTRHLITLAQKLEARRSWNDLVLPHDTLAQLKEFCQQARRRVQVYETWGFGRRLSLGKGLTALFSGSSGTGKTLAAEVLAHDLGLDLYRVDLSSVVSKYIGETEKNLSKVFHEAQESNAILFFDEADALFGKRTEVKDAHDRYANIEVNFLLQQVEAYEGMVILASNMSKNIDQAFQRRLNYSIDFPFPDEDHRLRIWQGIYPAETPLSPELDFAFLARKFKIAGGNIKNVAVASAFQAAADGGLVCMEHVIWALKREYQKLGKVCEPSEFERYYDLVHE